MSGATLSVQPETRLNTSALRGRIDAVDGNRVFGWAWHPENPRERVSVRLFDDDGDLATIVADKPRIDLRRNGVGDGGHAFDVELERAVTGELRAVAIHPDEGPDLDLAIPVTTNTAETSLAASFGPVLDRIELAILAQRRVQSRQTGLLGELTGATKRLTEVAATDGLVETVRGLSERQQALTDRLGELEVFLVRFDSVIGDFSARLDALAKQHVHPIKGHLMWLTAAVGLVIGVALTAAMRL